MAVVGGGGGRRNSGTRRANETRVDGRAAQSTSEQVQEWVNGSPPTPAAWRLRNIVKACFKGIPELELSN